jgi:cell division protein FtsB
MRFSISKVILFLVVLGGAAYGFLALRNSRIVVASDEKRRQIEQLEQENGKLRRAVADKQTYVEELKNNPDRVRLIIKDQLKLVDPGTKNFLLQEGPSKEVPPAAQHRP